MRAVVWVVSFQGSHRGSLCAVHFHCFVDYAFFWLSFLWVGFYLFLGVVVCDRASVCGVEEYGFYGSYRVHGCVVFLCTISCTSIEILEFWFRNLEYNLIVNLLGVFVLSGRFDRWFLCASAFFSHPNTTVGETIVKIMGRTDYI